MPTAICLPVMPVGRESMWCTRVRTISTGWQGHTQREHWGGLSIYEMRGLWHQSKAVGQPGYETTDHYHYCEVMELSAAREAQVVATISDALRCYLLNHGIDEKKIRVLPNAVDTDRFLPMSPNLTLKTQLGLTDRTVVGFIGSLTAYEGLEDMVTAVLRLIAGGLPISLVVVGEGDAKQRLKSLIAGTGHGAHVHLIGKVPFEKVREYYSIIDIFPYPRKNALVCRLVPPLKILEAMAMEKTVIVSDLPPLLELVTHNQTGLACPCENPDALAETIRRAAIDRNLRRTLGGNAGRWVRAHRSWNSLVHGYLEMYGTG